MRFFSLKSRVVPAGFFFLLIILASCKQKVRLIQSPPHYSFKSVQSTKIDLKLKEISGIAWDNKRDEFLTHYDEAGNVYILDKSTYAITSEFTFGSKGDYEDITIYKGVPYILISNGTIIKLVRDSTGRFIRGETAGKLNITSKGNDFETLYADTARKALIMVCKNCEMDDKTRVSAFAFYPDSIGFVNEPVFTIDAAKIKEMSVKQGHHKTSKFQPSAASIHPIDKKLYIISSASSQLVIADQNGNPEQVYELGQKLFPQPEGLTFKNDGTMYISNEGVAARATILLFRYKPL